MKTWKNVCPNGELKLELSEGMETLAEIPLVKVDSESNFDQWCENGFNAVLFNDEIYMKLDVNGNGDLEMLTIDEANQYLIDNG